MGTRGLDGASESVRATRQTGARPGRAWLRAAVALPAAITLALPAAALTGVGGAQQAFADELSTSCTDVVGSGSGSQPRSGGEREQVARTAAARWFPPSHVDMATAVAGAESSWRPTAVNKAAGGNYGLWQINAIHSDLLKGRDWQDPEVNAWMAYKVWDAADGTRGDRRGSWKPWSVFTSGSYRAYLPEGAEVPREDRDPNGAPAGGEVAADGEVTADGCIGTGGPGIRVATWNAKKSNSEARIAAGTRALTGQADVFGLQELGDESKRAAAAKGAVGFTMTTDRTAVPILYRTSQYTLLGQGRELALREGTSVEHSPYDGKAVTGIKWVTWVHLMDNTTLQSFYVLNTHLLVGAENSVRTRKANPRRVEQYHRQLSTLTSLADAFRADGSTVYATCDCNVNYSPKVAPVRKMARHDLIPSWQTLDSPATHGKRAIDYVWSTEAPASQVTGDHHGSDHASLTVTFLGSATHVVTGSARQQTARTRIVTDAGSQQTYEVPIPEGRAGRAMDFALDQLGDRWVWGSHGPDAWDSSGLTAGAWKTAGVSITPQSDAQRRSVPRVRLAAAQPGDVVWRKGYVGIYLGTVGDQRVVVGAVRAKGAVVIHPADDDDITAVLRPS